MLQMTRILGEDCRRYEAQHLKECCQHKYLKNEYVYSSDNSLVRELFWLRLTKTLEGLNGCQRHRVIDVGCGEGFLLLSLAKVFEECVGVDLSIKTAKELMDDFRVENVGLIEGNFDDMGFEENSFDLVTATDVLEHVPFLFSFVEKIEKILKPNGLFLATLPAENSFYRLGRKVFGFSQGDDPSSCPHIHNAKAIMKILKKRFKIVERKFIPFGLAFISPFYLIKMTK